MAKIAKEFIETYIEKGIDIDNRRVFLIGEIDDDSVGNVIKALYLIEAASAEKPVELFINSPGGSITAALGLYDVINTLKCPFHTFAVGQCCSAAPLLLACGENGQRWVGENTLFMTHQGSEEISGKFSDLKATVQASFKLDHVWNRLIARHSKKPVSFWTRKSRGPDFYFTAEEAIEWGIADSIWNEKQQ